jgi:threonine dehydratase
MTSRSEIVAAHELVRDLVRRTPVVGWDGLVLKLEHLQHAGSFKPRGAFTTVLSQPSPPVRLVAASGGNHGLAVAHVGATLGIPTEIYVPDIASRVKIAGIEARGAKVHVGGANYSAALTASGEAAGAPGTLAIHAYDAPFTLAGQGTVALELEEQAPLLDTVVVAVGGGGLIGGVASWYTGRVRVIAVEPAGATALAAIRSGAFTPGPGERVGVVLCGGNTDPSDLGGDAGEARRTP